MKQKIPGEIMNQETIDKMEQIKDEITTLRLNEVKAKLEHAHSIASDIIETYALIESSRKRCADNYLKMKGILDSAVKDVDLPIDNVESNLADDLATITGELNVVEDTDDKILRFIKAIDDDRFRKLLDKDLNSTIY